MLLLLWQVDEDADDLSFPAMVSQLLEFVLCIVGNEKFLPLLQPVLPELAYLIIGGLPAMAIALYTVRCLAAYTTAPHTHISASVECTFHSVGAALSQVWCLYASAGSSCWAG